MPSIISFLILAKFTYTNLNVLLPNYLKPFKTTSTPFNVDFMWNQSTSFSFFFSFFLFLSVALEYFKKLHFYITLKTYIRMGMCWIQLPNACEGLMGTFLNHLS